MGKIKLLLAVRKSILDQQTLETVAHEEDMEIVGNAIHLKGALVLARRHKPDILLLDSYTIKREQALERIKELDPGVRFIVVSDDSKNNSEDLFRSIESGAKGYISKDIPPEELLDNIRLVNEGGCVMDPELVSVFLDKFRELTVPKKKVPCPRKRKST